MTVDRVTTALRPAKAWPWPPQNQVIWGVDGQGEPVERAVEPLPTFTPGVVPDFGLFKTAGITQGEAAQLIGVSRVSFHKWSNGVAKPRRTYLERIAALQCAIKCALFQNILPLPADSDARKLRLKRLSNETKVENQNWIDK